MVNFYASINSLGYGVHSYNFMKALDSKGVDIAYWSVNNNPLPFTNVYIDRWIENQKKYNSNQSSVMIYHEFMMNRFSGKIRIGFPVIETGITKKDLVLLKGLDYILQPSEYGKNLLKSYGLENIYVIPEGYDNKVFDINKVDSSLKLKQFENIGIIFSHIGKLESRKSTLDILRVWTQSLYGCGKKCKLIAHVRNIFMENWLEIVKSELSNLGYTIAGGDEVGIKFIRDNLTIFVLQGNMKAVQDIYYQSHFGIYASKAEGWGLPLMESLACGVPCITGNWSGESEYLKGYPEELIIKSKGKEIANDGMWFMGNKGEWDIPDLSSMKGILQSIVKDPIKYYNLSNNCFKCVEKYTWEHSADWFIDTMADLKVEV